MTELFGRNPNWLERLLTRRVPQNLAAYAVACWGGVQFVDWLTERYQVSAYLTDFFVYTVILLVPSVVILAYFRGESGPTPWSWVEKAGIPLNLVVLAGVLFLNFQGKELGMVNTMVTVQDGNGRNVQRAVPKGAFRKHIALFFFQNTSGEQGLDWLRQGVPDLLATDLSQDLYLDVRDGYDLVERIQKATFSYRDDLGLGLERDIASYYRLEYLVRGTFSKNKNRYRIQVTLYETERVKQLTQRVYEGEDLFALVDRMSVQLKQDVGVPVQHLEQGLDMPIAEVSTQSLPALAHAITAQNLLKFDQDYRAAARQLEQAVAQDPTYAMGHYLRFVTFFNSGEIDRANREIRKAKRYIFKLTEYYQFVANSNFYFATGQAQEQRNVLKQWVALYPEDVQAHSRLARFYEGTTQFQEAIQASERVLELDPDQTEYLLQIGELYARQGQPQ
ncbi:hypothetical protein [Candidatus Cyanaurora vandensis]|nr:hypothetical protein [Candidatus Cyanaurora vandensis]